MWDDARFRAADLGVSLALLSARRNLNGEDSEGIRDFFLCAFSALMD